ncbi:hypothetical protein [Burkholderia pseudomallei]|nr:hypothetical protein [Burkholderia pseudomallei]
MVIRQSRRKFGFGLFKRLEIGDQSISRRSMPDSEAHILPYPWRRPEMNKRALPAVAVKDAEKP